MRQPLIENAKKFRRLQDEVNRIQEEIIELQRDTFGVDSEETEEKARKLFAEIGSTENGPDHSNQIDELRSERRELEAELGTVESELLEQVADIRFPLDGTINNEGESVIFPFEESIEEEVLDAISEAVAEDLSQDSVVINTDSIAVDTESTNEAIEAVKRRVMNLRRTAEAHYDAAEHIEALNERDDKVAGMMHTLSHSEEPLTKSELEKRMGLGSGDLRGQLYYVLKNDPYLKKPDKKVELTSTGQMVIDEYVNHFGEPTWDIDSEQDEKDKRSEEAEA